MKEDCDPNELIPIPHDATGAMLPRYIQIAMRMHTHRQELEGAGFISTARIKLLNALKDKQ